MILHIPHSGTNTLDRNIEQFDIDYLTDWYTDKIFWHENSERLVLDVSRFVCDVERFPDEQEEMFKICQGICYTKGTRDNVIEVIDKEYIIKEIYDKWHSELNKKVAWLLTYIPKVVLVDCHSFPDKEGYPDFCIGITEQTPKELVELVQVFLDKNNYSNAINYPYSGCMTPSKYQNHADVFPILIEVNKKLYLNTNEDFEKIKFTINKLLDEISKYELSFH